MATFEPRLDTQILETIARAERDAPPTPANVVPLYDMLRYHLGFLNETLQPERVNAGKRIRPRLTVLITAALGGDPDCAYPTAAAIELLHNFTLIHDDIQDRSTHRRHRRTIWDLWGTAQAINAGDAAFALAYLSLHASPDVGVSLETTQRLSTHLHETTLRIVEGQTLDLGFESLTDVPVEQYRQMIAGKTGTLTRYACWAGAVLAGAGDANALADFGFALGTGFQLRDDILGVWGTTAETGKPEADDIRRRKKSLPILLLRERADAQTLFELDAIYSHDDVTEADVGRVLELLLFHEVREDVQARVQEWHDRARDLLLNVLPESSERGQLLALVEALETRVG